MVRFVGWYLLTFFSQKLTIFLQQEETRNYLRIKFTNDNDTHINNDSEAHAANMLQHSSKTFLNDWKNKWL